MVWKFCRKAQFPRSFGRIAFGLNNLPFSTWVFISSCKWSFGYFKNLGNKNSLNLVVKELFLRLYSDYVKMPENENEWINKIKGFIGNYEFPSFGVWYGFHVYISCKLKNFYNFKHRYSVSYYTGMIFVFSDDSR